MNEYAGAESPHVLILRLWCEPRTGAESAPVWRALIEHVGTSKRYPIKDMTALYALLAPYGNAMALNDFLASQNASDEG